MSAWLSVAAPVAAQVAIVGLAAVLVMMTLLWIASLRLRDASIVDRFWGMAFVLLVWVYLWAAAPAGGLAYLLAALVSVWGLRLSWHIHRRNRGGHEDHRYARMREAHGARFWWYSLFSVFLLQGLLAWVVAAPFVFVMVSPAPVNGAGFVLAGVALWLLGFVFEALSDWQLARFKGDPDNAGKLLTSGLWSLSRHPNYFGDATLWWGYFLIAVSVERGWMSVFGPLLMTVLIVFVSGVAMKERDQRRKRPEYADYIRRTPVFVPWPKRWLGGNVAAFAALCALLAAASPAPRVQAASAELTDGQVVHFEVLDAGGGALLYSGVERIRVRDGEVEKRTVYEAPGRGEVKVDRVRYELDSLRVSEFESVHPVRGERLALRRDGARLHIEYRPRAGEPLRRDDTLEWGAQMRLGPTLHHIIVRNWDALLAGERVEFDLLVPSRFGSYRFRLEHVAQAGGDARVFRLAPAAWMLRQLVSPMDFHYDRQRRAVKYVGPTTVSQDEDPDRRVEIRFWY